MHRKTHASGMKSSDKDWIPSFYQQIVCFIYNTRCDINKNHDFINKVNSFINKVHKVFVVFDITKQTQRTSSNNRAGSFILDRNWFIRIVLLTLFFRLSKVK